MTDLDDEVVVITEVEICVVVLTSVYLSWEIFEFPQAEKNNVDAKMQLIMTALFIEKPPNIYWY